MTASADVVVGRQGIHTADGVVAYELLFRRVGALAGRTAVTADQMTAAVLFGAMAIGLDQLVGDRLVFCRGDRGLLTGEVPLLLPADRTVVEVAATVELDDEVMAGCARLVAQGYRLALDHFGWPAHERLLPLAAVVKVDVMMTPPDALAELVTWCRARGVRVLATHVARREDVAALAERGFTLFQGFALDRPELVSGRATEACGLAGVTAAAELLGSEADFDRLEELLRRDPALALQIMQLASVGRLGEPRRRINTIHDALVLAGLDRVRNWLALLLARPVDRGPRAHDAFVATLLRARVVELVAAELDPASARLGFAAGMLSALELLLAVPIEDIAAGLPLSEDLRAAAFGGEGMLAAIVRDVAAYQDGDRAPEVVPLELLDHQFARAFPWALGSATAADAAEPVPAGMSAR